MIDNSCGQRIWLSSTTAISTTTSSKVTGITIISTSSYFFSVHALGVKVKSLMTSINMAVLTYNASIFPQLIGSINL